MGVMPERWVLLEKMGVITENDSQHWLLWLICLAALPFCHQRFTLSGMDLSPDASKPVRHVESFDLLDGKDRRAYEELVNGTSPYGPVQIKGSNDFPVVGGGSGGGVDDDGQTTRPGPAIMRVLDFTTKPVEQLPFTYHQPIC